MKKVFSILAITVLMVSMMGITAFAHGGGRGQSKANRADSKPLCNLCSVESCEIIGSHKHDDSRHCSQTERTDGYEVCTMVGCGQLGLHEHDGEYFYCQNHDAGHGCGRNKVR